MTVYPIPILLALMLAPLAAHAAVYKYVDEHGVTRYTDVPPKDRATSTLQVQQSTPAEQAEQATLSRMRESDQRAAETERRLQALEEERARADRAREQAEANRKFSGCKLADQLRNLTEGQGMSQKLIDSATSMNYGHWDTPRDYVLTRILSYEPVCGNSTRTVITINAGNYIWELKRDIAH